MSENDPAPLRQGETGPGKLATTTLFDVDETTATRPQIAREWDNRRAAERRRMSVPKRRQTSSASRVVWVEVGPKNTAAVSGERIFPSVRQLGIPYQWHPYRQDVLCIPVAHADDVIAYLEHRCRRHVEVVSVDRV